MIHRTLRTETCQMSVNDEGIIIGTYFDGIEETLPQAKATIAMYQELAQGGKCLLMLDTRNILGLNHEVRDYYANHDPDGCYAAAAIIVSSPFTVMVMNLFLALNKAPSPTKIFWDPNRAIKWLRTQQHLVTHVRDEVLR
jgi:hypothetical protein